MMNELEMHSQVGHGLREQPATAQQVMTQLGKCLVVSESVEVRSCLAVAAQSAGWATVVCPDGNTAVAAMERVRFQLAWVDLQAATAAVNGADRLLMLRRLCESLSTQSGALLVICGHANDVAEEIWARQLGVWLYLPEVDIEELGELSYLCEQARLIATEPPFVR